MPHDWESVAIVADRGDAEKEYYATGRPISLLEYNRSAGMHAREESESA
jgi:hypothetical protein